MVECGGLENRLRVLPRTGVRIPPPPPCFELTSESVRLAFLLPVRGFEPGEGAELRKRAGVSQRSAQGAVRLRSGRGGASRRRIPPPPPLFDLRSGPVLLAFFKNDGNAQIHPNMASIGRFGTLPTWGFANKKRRLLGKAETIYAFPSFLFPRTDSNPGRALHSSVAYGFLRNRRSKSQKLIGSGNWA